MRSGFSRCTWCGSSLALIAVINMNRVYGDRVITNQGTDLLKSRDKSNEKEQFLISDPYYDTENLKDEVELVKRATLTAGDFIRWAIICPPISSILIEMNQNPWSYSVVDSSPQARPVGGSNNNDYAESYYQEAIHECHNCECDPASAEMVVSRNPESDLCKQEDMLVRCQEWMKCFCYARLINPNGQKTEGVPYGKWQSAINAIPHWLKLMNPSKVWGTNAGIPLTWWRDDDGNIIKMNGGSETVLRASSHKQQVPGAKEPYFVQGPGSFTWDWLVEEAFEWGLGYGEWALSRAARGPAKGTKAVSKREEKPSSHNHYRFHDSEHRN